MSRRIVFKRIFVTLVGLALVIVLVNLVLFIQRLPLGKVEISVLPPDSIIKLGDEIIKPGTHYLKPSTYTITTSRQFFTDGKKTIKVEKGKTYRITLAPIPSTPEAIDLLNNNPQLQLQRESIGANYDNTINKKLSDSKILQKLPHADLEGAFEITYTLNDKNEPILSISSLAPSGRLNGLKWIEEQGDTPSKYVILFPDFINPLEGGSDNNE